MTWLAYGLCSALSQHKGGKDEVGTYLGGVGEHGASSNILGVRRAVPVLLYTCVSHSFGKANANVEEIAWITNVLHARLSGLDYPVSVTAPIVRKK